MEEKVKSLSLSKLKIAETEVSDGKTERRVTFVASTANEDRDYEVVEIETFRLPLKGGGHIVVKDLPAGGIDSIDIPFLTNHDLWDVEKTIGSVRRAEFIDGRLIFEAGISSRSYAQDVFKLIEEGHLDNAFSIQYRDYSHNSESHRDTDGEIVEVSLVTRGSNKDAQVLAVKSLKEKEMDESQIKSVENPEDQAPEASAKTTDNETPEAPAQETATESEGEKELDNQEKANDATPEDGKKEKSMYKETNQNEMAAKQVKQPSQSETSAKSADSDYLKSKQAERDFAQTIVENYGKSSQMVMKSWSEKLQAKGITGDAILPKSIETIFFKAWEDKFEALGTFRTTTNLNGSVYAFNTNDRAQGHKKGDKKAEQSLTDIRRDYKAKIMYKKLAIDLQDLIDDQTGELLRFRTEELASRIGDELVRAVVFGDGRTAPTGKGADYRIFDGTRGPWSMKNDIDKADSTNANDAFSNAVATKIANVDTDNIWQKIVKTKGAIKGGVGRKIIFVPEGTETELALMADANGKPVFAPGTNFQEILGVYLFESPYMTDSGYDVIGYRENSYLLAMGNAMIRTLFDLDYNQDVMLQERAVAGTAYGNKVLAGYQSKA